MPSSTPPPRRTRVVSWPLLASGAPVALVTMIIGLHVLARTT